MAYIKNISHEEVLHLTDQISADKGQIVSKTLAQNDHDSTGDAMVLVLEGTGQFTVDGKEYILQAGDTLVMPAKKPHSVYAKEDFKWLLTVVFPS